MKTQSIRPGAAPENFSRSFLARLRSDVGGNVIALTAAAVIPMIGIVGGAVDMSRAYMTKARLQASCDAGVLAGRKAMTNLVYTPEARARADRMFDFNYRPDNYQASATTFTSSANATGLLSGTARTTIPTVLMQVFGKTQMSFTANCSADLQVPNIDTMLVLDVTGSMAWCPNGTNSCGNGGAGSRIEGLRTSVRSFYDTLQTAAATSPTAQIRYGFVPYSQMTNGSELFKASPGSGQLPLTQLVNNMDVQSRVANFNTPETTSMQLGSPAPNSETYQKPRTTPTVPTDTPMSYDDCRRYRENIDYSIDDGPDAVTYFTASPSGRTVYRIVSTGTLQSSRPADTATYDQIYYSDNAPDLSLYPHGNVSRADNLRTCNRSFTTTRFGPSTVFRFTSWTYKKILPVNVSQFKAGNSINYVSGINASNALSLTSASYDPIALRQQPNQAGLTSSSTTWRGCLEERTTVAVSNFSPIPAGAKDLDYLNAGTNDATYWRPIFSDLTYLRSGESDVTDTNVNSGSRPGAACPGAPMLNLNTMTSAQINTYLPLLQPNGSTYHDIGMVWGLRLLTPNGMFSSRNLVGANGGQISRNLIFMTDGEMAPTDGTYSSYGVERMDKKVTRNVSGANQMTLHNRRFQALCDAARSQGISVWVIAFGQTLTANLTSCADPGRAYEASNAAQLTARFQQIALDIADLRLTQ